MKKHSKRYEKGRAVCDSSVIYPVAEAISHLTKMPAAKFDETVELACSLGVDPRQSDQMVRGIVALPHGSGKNVRVLVFTEEPEKALAAGAEAAGLTDLIEKIQGGWFDFDVAIATTSAMKEVRTVAKVLGPRGLMPNPKSGTVTDDVERTIGEVKSGRTEFKMDKTANLAVVVGRRSFDEKKLEDNIGAALEAIRRACPASFSGKFIRRAAISTTMSPSISIEIKEVASA